MFCKFWMPILQVWDSSSPPCVLLILLQSLLQTLDLTISQEDLEVGEEGNSVNHNNFTFVVSLHFTVDNMPVIQDLDMAVQSQLQQSLGGKWRQSSEVLTCRKKKLLRNFTAVPVVAPCTEVGPAPLTVFRGPLCSLTVTSSRADLDRARYASHGTGNGTYPLRSYTTQFNQAPPCPRRTGEDDNCVPTSWPQNMQEHIYLSPGDREIPV